jgi:hypothetical protein
MNKVTVDFLKTGVLIFEFVVDSLKTDVLIFEFVILHTSPDHFECKAFSKTNVG